MREIKSGAEITKCSDIQAEGKSWTQKGHLQSAGTFIIKKQIKKNPYEQKDLISVMVSHSAPVPGPLGFVVRFNFRYFIVALPLH